MFDLPHAGDVPVVGWVDGLGRNCEDVSDAIRAFMPPCVVINTIINGMVFDGATKNPMTQAVRGALSGFMAALSHRPRAEADEEAQRGWNRTCKGGHDERLTWTQADPYRSSNISSHRVNRCG